MGRGNTTLKAEITGDHSTPNPLGAIKSLRGRELWKSFKGFLFALMVECVMCIRM